MDEIVVSVFGTGRVKPDQPAYGFAEQVGRALAQAGFAIANGGYRGIMQASAKGAAEAGGTVIGVTCSAFKKSVANEYVTREMTTGSLDERLDTLVKLGRAYVVLPGGTGTLLELAMVWELKNKGFLDAGQADRAGRGLLAAAGGPDGPRRSGLREGGGLRRDGGRCGGADQGGTGIMRANRLWMHERT